MRRIYLDHNATTPVDPAVIEEMQPFSHEQYGNPSSIHWAGRVAKAAIEKARERVAGLVNCHSSEVVFTSCASESNNMAIIGAAMAMRKKGNHIITTSVEHPSVLSPCFFLEQLGFRVTCIDVDGDGLIDLDALEAAIAEETVLISAMFANNETGTIFPVADIGAIAARRGLWFHCDGVQAVGKVPVDLQSLEISFLSISGHKLYAPKGTGALIIRKGVRIPAFIHGGHQEKNRRAGTENVAGIVALGKACEMAREDPAGETAHVRGLRDRLEAGILDSIPAVRLNGDPVKRIPNTSNISFINIEKESLARALDREGVAVSSGSACSSGALRTSHVIKALGLDEDTPVCPVRFSFGRWNTAEEVDYVLEMVPRLVEELRGGKYPGAAGFCLS